MPFYILLILIPAAAFALTSVLAAALASAAWPLVREWIRGTAASSRARAIGILRLAPVLAGVLSSVILLSAFIRFEPRDTTETPGLLLSVSAGVAFVLVVAACRRIMRALRSGAQCTRLIRLGGRRLVGEDGTPLWVLDTPYPIAAVTGIFRTRLLLSARVIRECTAGELDAIVKHERAHVLRRDNLVRAAMRYLPDPLAFSRAGREMEQAWAAAAEEAADDVAAGEAGEARAMLASALVRVARMAGGPVPEWMPGLAFYEGTNLETRVRRLIEGGSLRDGLRRHSVVLLIAIFAGSAFALTEPVAWTLHTWMEVAVQLAP